MKKSVRIIALALAVLLVCAALTACSAAAKTEGKYISVAFTINGEMYSGSNAEGLILELMSHGKGTYTVADTSYDIEWSLEGGTITVSNEQGEMTGTVDGDTVTLQNIGDSGIDIIFAREGSEAADPANYMTEE